MYNNREAKVISRVKRKSKYKKAMTIFLIIVIVQFAAVESVLICNGKSDPEVRTDYLVILGAGIKGERLSLALYERLMVGLSYLEKYPDTRVVVSGGQGPDEAITEAEAMRRFLVSKGIEEGRILLETRATSTMENFAYSRKLIEQDAAKPSMEITFVTSSFHILRAKMLADRNDFTAHALSAKTPWQVIVQVYFREYFAIFKSLIVDR
ncbi:MAG: YdcF family protein [Clostridiaceae bacterium]